MTVKEFVVKFQRRVGLSLTSRFMDRKKGEISTKASEVVRIGTSYGGWILPKDFLISAKTASILCAGAGEDISFDTEMARLYKCKVVTLDPTPRAIKHFSQLKEAVEKKKSFYTVSNSEKFKYLIDAEDIERIIFLPIGISKAGGVQKFYFPQNEEHVSCSIANLQKTDKYFEAECLKYDQILERVKFKHFDLVKIDIEGAEYGVLESIMKSQDRPEIICVDFDEMNNVIDWKAWKRMDKAFRNLSINGYVPIWVEGDSVTFQFGNFGEDK